MQLGVFVNEMLTRWRRMRFAAGNHGARGKRRCGNITDDAGETILISPAAGQFSGCTGACICDLSFFSSLACVLKSWCGVWIKLVSASWTYWTWILRIMSKESIVKADLVLEVAWWVRDGGGGQIAPATSWLQIEENLQWTTKQLAGNSAVYRIVLLRSGMPRSLPAGGGISKWFFRPFNFF